LKVLGPLEHAYWDMAIQAAPHILEIWLPVNGFLDGKTIEGLKHIPGYKCLTAAFKRPIEEIGDAWMALGEKAKASGYQLTNHDREVYRMMDCDHPENNDIELQIGIK
jgi:effector-binding domain-containing protein